MAIPAFPDFNIHALLYSRKLDTTDFVQQMHPHISDTSISSLLNIDPFSSVLKEGCMFFLDTTGRFCIVWNTYDKTSGQLDEMLNSCGANSQVERYRNPNTHSDSANSFVTPDGRISIHRPYIYVVRGPQYVYIVCNSCGQRAHNFDEEEALMCIPPRDVLKFGDIVIPAEYREQLYFTHPQFTTEEVVGTYLDHPDQFIVDNQNYETESYETGSSDY